MKTKIILPTIIVLFAAILVANGIYGRKVAKEIDSNLQEKIAEKDLPADITYSAIKVNPLCSKVKFEDVSISDPESKGSFKCKMLNLDIPYKEVLRWTKSEGLEEINSFELTLVEPQIIGDGSGPSVDFSELVVDFDGQLSKADWENLETRFPAEKQKIEVTFSDMKVNFPMKGLNHPLLSELQKQFSDIEAGSYKLAYLPESHEIDIIEFSIESPVISYKGNALFKYEGNNASEFKPRTVDMKTAMRLEPKHFEWEDENGGKGDFRLDKLVFNTNTSVSFDNKAFPQGDMNIDLKNLVVNYDKGNANKRNSMLNLSVKDLDIKSLKFNYHLDKEKLSITDSRIESSLLEADIYADADVDNSNPANSTIKEAKVTVHKLGPDLEKLVNGFEQQMGKKLPRENGAIVLELSGKLGRPTIKGFEL
ncbi:MAG: hypothetical protein ACK5M7_02705 [Draconibacterium sp.]